MKKKLLLASLATATLFLSQNDAFATVHTIQVGTGTNGVSFSPASGVNAVVGDSISFVWSTGSHTTTSTNIPSGATQWDNPINSTSTNFIYVPTVAGTYNYQCTFHVSMGMTGSFVVTAPSAVPSVAGNEPITVSPNPASSQVKVHTTAKNAAYSLYDLGGKLISVMQPVNKTETDVYLNVSKIAAGIYMLKVESDNGTSMVKLEISK